jgi:hypothetical protein
MNEACETYLKTYSAVDKIDQMLLGWDVKYKSWRWWHAPMRHAKAIAMSMAYSLCVCGCVILTSSRGELPSDAVPTARKIHPPPMPATSYSLSDTPSASPWEDV